MAFKFIMKLDDSYTDVYQDRDPCKENWDSEGESGNRLDLGGSWSKNHQLFFIGTSHGFKWQNDCQDESQTD